MREQIDRWNADTGSFPERLKRFTPSESSALIRKIYLRTGAFLRTSGAQALNPTDVCQGRSGCGGTQDPKELSCKTKRMFSARPYEPLGFCCRAEQARSCNSACPRKCNRPCNRRIYVIFSILKLPPDRKRRRRKRERTEREHAARNRKEPLRTRKEIQRNRPVRTDERPAETENSDRTEIELLETGDIAFPSDRRKNRRLAAYAGCHRKSTHPLTMYPPDAEYAPVSVYKK